MFKYLINLIAALILTGCTAATATLPAPLPAVSRPSATGPAAVQAITPTEEALAASATPAPTITQTTVPLSTETPLPTTTATPTPFPMSIAAMRARTYPGSPVTIEQELDPGANYHRYYASYLSDGLKIYALLTVPNGDPPSGGWSAIVFNHGYIPPEVYRTTERYVAYVDSLARAGYIVFRIDYRGHDRSEGRARGAYGDPGYTVDVLNAVASIKQFPQANPDKIGMWGHSMGGFLTLRAMVISPDIKVGVIWGGVVASYQDLFSKWHRGPEPTPTPPPYSNRWRDNWVRQFGTPEQNPAFWNSVSANSFLADLSGPLQLDHSTTDEEVPVEFSRTLAGQIQRAGGTVELYEYPGDNHNISKNFSLAMSRTIKFFDTYLKP